VRPGEAIAQLLTAQRGTFVHAQVVALTGVKDDSLQNWTKRKIISPVWPSPGRHGRREYSGRDLAGVFLGSKLVDLGLPPALALPTGWRCVTDFTMQRADFEKRSDRRATFADEDAHLIELIIGSVSEGVLETRLLQRAEFRKFDSGLTPFIALPIGRLLLDLSMRAYGRE
jgi:hypothetical protein